MTPKQLSSLKQDVRKLYKVYDNLATYFDNPITTTISVLLQNLAFDGAEKIIRGFLSIPSISMTTPFAYPYAPISYACIPCMASNPRFVRIEWLDPKHPKVLDFIDLARFSK